MANYTKAQLLSMLDDAAQSVDTVKPQMVLNQEYEKYLKQKALFEKEHEVKKKKLVKVYKQFGTQMIYTHI